uniref:Adenylosuccinate lyase n=1 Tax=Strongyloides venezuelensis TaxID=75913 RepID=A0A0K0FEG0_STRVS
MRQRGDTTFIDILNNLRVGKLTNDQLAVLLRKKEEYRGENNSDLGKIMHILPTNKLVDEYNEEVLNYYKNDVGVIVHTIKATDEITF